MTTQLESADSLNLTNCPVCSSVFAQPRRAARIYCSDKCAKRAKYDRQYGPSRPGRGQRRPLPESARTSGWRLRRDIERIERIFNDDRFSSNKRQVAATLRGHLEYAAEVCQDLLSRLDTEGEQHGGS